VRRFRALTVANTPIMPGLPGALLRLPAGSVVHLHVAQAFVPEAVYLAKVARRIPYIAQIHIDVGPSGPAGFLLRVWKPLVLGPILRRANTITVFTCAQRSAIAAKYRIDPERIAVIPNGVDASFFHEPRREPQARARLLFVGRLSVQKNLFLLLRALEGVSSRFETTLVGDGELAGELKKTVRDLRLEGVRFYGRADAAELRQLYRDADLFVLPSDREGMPLALLEAMAAGLPVVGTDVPGIRDVVTQGESGILVPPRDHVALRAALVGIAGDPERYRLMSEAAFCSASKYTWDAVGAAFDRLYRDVAS
jgi:glycosyltransferase involved in cell wall biosynthesis